MPPLPPRRPLLAGLASRTRNLRGFINRAHPFRGASGFSASMHSHGGPAPLVLPNVWPTPMSPFNRGFSGFNGLDHYDQRFADSGNQFSIEPPDMCVATGAGFVLQAVNDVVNVYDGDGNIVVPTSSLNQFFGYPSAIIRTPLAFGPSITDPTCYFDQATQRFFLTVLTLEQGTDGRSLPEQPHRHRGEPGRRSDRGLEHLLLRRHRRRARPTARASETSPIPAPTRTAST